MKKGKGEKVKSDAADKSSWIGSMKDQITVHGDIFSTGSWPSDDELETSYREMAADTEGEAEALEWIEGTIGDFCDEPWEE